MPLAEREMRTMLTVAGGEEGGDGGEHLSAQGGGSASATLVVLSESERYLRVLTCYFRHLRGPRAVCRSWRAVFGVDEFYDNPWVPFDAF